MKQLIVLIATMVLGVGIAGIVLGFGNTAKDVSKDVTGQVKALGTVVQNYTTSGAFNTIPPEK